VAGSRLAFFLVVGNADYAEKKDDIVSLMLVNELVLIPVVCVVVGALVAAITRRASWWLGGIAVLPLFIVGLIRSGGELRIGSLLV